MATGGVIPKTALAIAAAALVGLAVAWPFEAARADHVPANKIAVSGASVEILTAPLVDGASSMEETVLSGTLRASRPTDLVVGVTLECALWTTVVTVGNDASEATARVLVWVELDGEPVAVSGDDTEAPGQVVFCDRTHRQTVTDLDDEDARIEQFLRTRSANGFHWIALNVGSGIHTLDVVAQLEASATSLGDAQAGVGKRTLVVEPVRLAGDVTI